MKRSPLQRRTPLRPVSQRTATRRSERDAVRRTVHERDRNCQAALLAPGPCSGPHDVHELVRRSQWADGQYKAENCVLVCRAHHEWIGGHPAEAHRLGLLLWSWERPDEE